MEEKATILVTCKKALNCLKQIRESNKSNANMIRPTGNKEYHSSVSKNIKLIIKKMKTMVRLISKPEYLSIIHKLKVAKLVSKSPKLYPIRGKASLTTPHLAQKVS